MVSDYPTPSEEETEQKTIEIIVTYKVKTDVPKDWTWEQLEEDIKENIKDYICDSDIVDVDVD